MSKAETNLLCAGGTMRGVFGAGVLTAFQDHEIYPHISRAYGVSAGAMDLAYFLAHQAHYGSTIYYEDLIDGSFIHPTYIITGIYWRLVSAIYSLPKKQLPKPVDIDYIFEEVMEQKPLDLKNLK